MERVTYIEILIRNWNEILKKKKYKSKSKTLEEINWE